MNCEHHYRPAALDLLECEYCERLVTKEQARKEAESVNSKRRLTVDDLIKGLHAINDGTDRDCLDGQSLAAVDLAGFVRQDAITSLLEHWADHLGDNMLASIMHDLDDVVDEIRAFKRAVQCRFADELVPPTVGPE